MSSQIDNLCPYPVFHISHHDAPSREKMFKKQWNNHFGLVENENLFLLQWKPIVDKVDALIPSSDKEKAQQIEKALCKERFQPQALDAEDRSLLATLPEFKKREIEKKLEDREALKAKFLFDAINEKVGYADFVLICDGNLGRGGAHYVTPLVDTYLVKNRRLKALGLYSNTDECHIPMKKWLKEKAPFRLRLSADNEQPVTNSVVHAMNIILTVINTASSLQSDDDLIHCQPSDEITVALTQDFSFDRELSQRERASTVSGCLSNRSSPIDSMDILVKEVESMKPILPLESNSRIKTLLNTEDSKEFELLPPKQDDLVRPKRYFSLGRFAFIGTMATQDKYGQEGIDSTSDNIESKKISGLGTA